jgi:hypothetical protein
VAADDNDGTDPDPQPSSPPRVFDDTMPAAPLRDGDAPGPPSPAVDRYRLGVELGRGGMGRVVEAFDVQLGRTVALKEAMSVRGGQSTYRRFAREVQITARLEHASIVPLYDSGTTPDGRPFYVMRKVSGRPLDEMIARARSVAERLVLLPSVLAAIDAIGHAHRRGIIHRDLKPANILLGDLGETVVIDWGLAKVIGEVEPSLEPAAADEPKPSDSLKTQVGSVFGTPGFMAPEQARGEELGRQTDVYALGACLYQLLAGVPPFGGSTSATEVMDRTRKNQMRPVAEAAPGAPPELAAIVRKALSLDPTERYADAGDLANDVRKFLAGQLVAAHRYTRRQRVARFARRNRLALTITALAAVVIAVLAWSNVSRILHERELEHDARLQALDVADALVLQSARDLLATDPTRALVKLRALQPDSPRVAEARAVASAAVMRGVALGIDTDDLPVEPADVTSDGKTLAVSTIGGGLEIYDLEHHALWRTRSVGRAGRGMFVEGGRRLFVWGSASPPYLYDPVTDRTTPIAAPGGHLATTDVAGDHVLYTLDRGVVARVDPATATVTQVWPGPGQVVLSGDGNYFAVTDGHAVTIHAADGHEVAHHEGGDLVDIIASPHGRLALTTATTLTELDVATGTWTDHPIDLPPHTLMLAATYRGERPAIYRSDGRLLEWVAEHWIERFRTPRVQTVPVITAGDVLSVAAENKIYWCTDTATGEIPLPPMQLQRVNGRSSSSRLVVGGRGLVLVYDLAAVVPGHVPGRLASGMFAVLDDDTLLQAANGDDWALVKLTGERKPFPFQWSGIPLLPMQTLTTEGRALVMFAEVREHILEIRDDARPVRHLAVGPFSPAAPTSSPLVGVLVPGDVTVFSDAEGRLYAAFGDGRPTEVTQMDGLVRSIAPLGKSRFVAVSENGEVVRAAVDADGASTVEHEHVTARDEPLVGSTPDGRALIGIANELLVWDRDVRPLFKFEKQILVIRPASTGVVVELADRSLVWFDPQTLSHRELVHRGVRAFVLDGARSLLAALDDAGHVTVIDLPVGEPFELASTYGPDARIGLTPTTRVLAVGDMDVDLWHLPRPVGDLAAWIDAHSNAVDGDRGVSWQWKKPGAGSAEPP